MEPTHRPSYRIRQRKGRILMFGCSICCAIGSSRTRSFSTYMRMLSTRATLAIVVSLGPAVTPSRQFLSVAGFTPALAAKFQSDNPDRLIASIS
jgi:hypothetical protein